MHPAAPGTLSRRLAALCYDGLVLTALLASFTLAIVALRGGRAIGGGTLWFEAALLAVVLLFFCWFWTHGGQTVGMRAWRIRVISEDGGSVRWGAAVVRFAAAILSVLPLGLGFWWSVLDARGRCWHDRLSRTRVVLETRARAS